MIKRAYTINAEQARKRVATYGGNILDFVLNDIYKDIQLHSNYGKVYIDYSRHWVGLAHRTRCAICAELVEAGYVVFNQASHDFITVRWKDGI